MTNKKTILQLKRKYTRAERADLTRAAILKAAAQVVGSVGYEDASVSKITDLAGIANGTFYNYFESRQDLFDQLLPEVGVTIIQFIREHMREDSKGLARERERITAYFSFFEQNPGFLRLLNEAEVFAPAAYEAHIDAFADGYIKALKFERKQNLLHNYSDAQLEVIVFMLMGCRSYITLLLKRTNTHTTIDLVDTYTKLIGPGLFK